MTHLSSARPSSTRRLLRRVGRALIVVAQLVVLFAPLAEGHEDRLLGAHVDAPRTTAHPGHHPESCPACLLLSVHSRPPERARLDVVARDVDALPPTASVYAPLARRAISNSSRAPPRWS
jgi:hypothetical protein